MLDYSRALVSLDAPIDFQAVADLQPVRNLHAFVLKEPGLNQTGFPWDSVAGSSGALAWHKAVS